MIRDEKMNVRKLQLVWTLVFALNLIVPLIFGWGIGDESAKAGLILAVGIYWLAGIFVCQKWRRMGQSLVAGGFLVAVTQLLPIAQICSGLAAREIWFKLSPSDQGLNTMLGGFFMTWVTGGLLIGLALLIGMFIVFVGHQPSKAKPELSESDRAWPVEP